MCIYILYMYREREKERYRDRQREREREKDRETANMIHIYACIHIHICILYIYIFISWKIAAPERTHFTYNCVTHINEVDISMILCSFVFLFGQLVYTLGKRPFTFIQLFNLGFIIHFMFGTGCFKPRCSTIDFIHFTTELIHIDRYC